MANERARGLGYKFVTDDKYLVDPFSPTEGISYEGDGSPVSYANSGIMAQAPIIYPPIINQGGGGDGPPGPADPGSYDSAFDPNNENEVEDFNYDIGEGTIAEEDDEKTKGLSIMDMVRAGGAYMVGGPFNAISSLNKTNNRNKQKEIDKINAAIEAQYGPSDPGSRGRDDTPGFGKTAEGNYSNQFEGGDPGLMADGGRAGYFFGGRVNYKAGGRTDAGPNRSTASKAGVGQINESGQKVSGGNFNNNNNNNDGGNNPPPIFYDNGIQVITDQSKLGFNYPTGLTKNLGVGQLTAILDARKSLKEEEPEGMIQYDSSVGPFDTRTTYDTTTGPEFNANYIGDNFDVGVNSKTGLSANYSKDIGPGTFTAGGTYNPDGTYNAEAKYGISFANGGLASIL